MLLPSCLEYRGLTDRNSTYFSSETKSSLLFEPSIFYCNIRPSNHTIRGRDFLMKGGACCSKRRKNLPSILSLLLVFLHVMYVPSAYALQRFRGPKVSFHHNLYNSNFSGENYKEKNYIQEDNEFEVKMPNNLRTNISHENTYQRHLTENSIKSTLSITEPVNSLQTTFSSTSKSTELSSPHPFKIPSTFISFQPSSFPTLNVPTTAHLTHRPTFIREKVVTGTYTWRIIGPCCDNGTLAEDDVDVIIRVLQGIATNYASSGNDAITITINTNVGQEEIVRPNPSISLTFKASFSSKNTDIVADDCAKFHVWFSETQQLNALDQMNRNISKDGYFNASIAFYFLSAVSETLFPSLSPMSDESEAIPVEKDGGNIKALICVYVGMAALLIVLLIFVFRHTSHDRPAKKEQDSNKVWGIVTSDDGIPSIGNKGNFGTNRLSRKGSLKCTISPESSKFSNHSGSSREFMNSTISTHSGGNEITSNIEDISLMTDDDSSFFHNEDSKRKTPSMVTEANFLCETYNWLKWNELALLEDRREYLQDITLKMVSYVQQEILDPDSASHIVHGCTALLGMELAKELPETTIIVTGMVKTCSKDDLVDVFKKLGGIQDAAVADNARGFGVICFKSPQSARKVMEIHRIEEIVVQDVAVRVQLLKARERLNTLPDISESLMPPQKARTRIRSAPNDPSRHRRNASEGMQGDQRHSLPYLNLQ